MLADWKIDAKAVEQHVCAGACPKNPNYFPSKEVTDKFFSPGELIYTKKRTKLSGRAGDRGKANSPCPPPPGSCQHRKSVPLPGPPRAGLACQATTAPGQAGPHQRRCPALPGGEAVAGGAGGSRSAGEAPPGVGAAAVSPATGGAPPGQRGLETPLTVSGPGRKTKIPSQAHSKKKPPGKNGWGNGHVLAEDGPHSGKKLISSIFAPSAIRPKRQKQRF